MKTVTVNLNVSSKAPSHLNVIVDHEQFFFFYLKLYNITRCEIKVLGDDVLVAELVAKDKRRAVGLTVLADHTLRHYAPLARPQRLCH